MATDFFNNTATLARQQALPGLKARAEREGLIISVCSGCFAYLGEQDGRGVTGLSHGYCPTCLEEFSAGMVSPLAREGAEADSPGRGRHESAGDWQRPAQAEPVAREKGLSESVPSHFSEGEDRI